jgi:hypothetical protein
VQGVNAVPMAVAVAVVNAHSRAIAMLLENANVPLSAMVNHVAMMAVGALVEHVPTPKVAPRRVNVFSLVSPTVPAKAVARMVAVVRVVIVLRVNHALRVNAKVAFRLVLVCSVGMMAAGVYVVTVVPTQNVTRVDVPVLVLLIATGPNVVSETAVNRVVAVEVWGPVVRRVFALTVRPIVRVESAARMGVVAPVVSVSRELYVAPTANAAAVLFRVMAKSAATMVVAAHVGIVESDKPVFGNIVRQVILVPPATTITTAAKTNASN